MKMVAALLFLFPQATGVGLVLDTRYFVGWGTLALINAGLAQGKNRSGLVWFCLSLLLGPLATFILVVLPK
jgi:hypothetical protein